MLHDKLRETKLVHLSVPNYSFMYTCRFQTGCLRTSKNLYVLGAYRKQEKKRAWWETTFRNKWKLLDFLSIFNGRSSIDQIFKACLILIGCANFIIWFNSTICNPSAGTITEIRSRQSMLHEQWCLRRTTRDWTSEEAGGDDEVDTFI